MRWGIFITLEGGEGTGKSTQSHLLSGKLKRAGRAVLQTREPGGSDNAENIRNLIVNGSPESWSPLSEALLMFAARDDHLQNCILPSLGQGKTVICDRFTDSTWAYQGMAGGVKKEFLQELEDQVVGPNSPDLTLVFDLDPEIGLARTRQRDQLTEGRFESKGLAYHRDIRAAFLEIAHKNPERCVVVDASLCPEDIETRVWQIVSDRFFESPGR